MIEGMKKSSRADRYLSKASTLLRACRDHGILVKVNVLLYAGETIQTLEQTSDWLMSMPIASAVSPSVP
jgi:hypothetical protein